MLKTNSDTDLNVTYYKTKINTKQQNTEYAQDEDQRFN